MSQYPEHDKLHAIKAQSQACGEFLKWLESEGIVLARYHQHTEDCGKVSKRFPDDLGELCGLRKNELWPGHRRGQAGG